MSPSRFPHQLMPPPEPTPTWQNREDGPLVYLAWGGRDYQRFPIPIHSNPGWTYWVLPRGRVRVEGDRVRGEFAAGEGFFAGPDCAFGLPLQPSPGARVLVWICREAPDCMKNPDPQTLHPVRFSEEQIHLLEELHAQTRLEIFQPRSHSHSALQHLCGLVEIQFTRAGEFQDADPSQIYFRRAEQWMLDHLKERGTMQDLATYLGISMMRLHRLFHQAAGTSPGAWFHDLKMRRSAELLKRDDASVKWVAYECGYRHANDFSRAFKKHFGFPPSALHSAYTPRVSLNR